jgi:phosphatidylserine/phosphatidylglycerophosphate/cardiolipin synthase-like enzyme
MPEDPPPAGDHTVQVLRTYPSKRPAYPFAPDGERSVARAYRKAIRRARRLIYVEDQYLWSEQVAAELSDALRREPDLRFVALVPRFPEQDGRLSGPPLRIGHQHALDMVRAAGGDRVAVYDLHNDDGVPIYVHAKVCVVDDTWVSIGSDNLNLRSWTHDSELSCAVLDGHLDGREPLDPGGLGDGARRLARELRLGLWAEHLDRPADDPELLDPVAGFEAWRTAARSGRGRVAEHQPRRLGWWASRWAAPAYRLFVDPDGRPRRMRRTRDF